MAAPRRPNTAAATAAVRRKAQERKAAELRAAGWAVYPPSSQHARLMHEFYGGPWHGARVEIESSPDGYEHLVPLRPEPGICEWVRDDAASGAGRYVRTGSYGETIVMTWTSK